MNTAIAQATATLIAALLTAVIALRLGTRQHKHFLLGRIADEYVLIRKAIVNVVAELSDLRHTDDLTLERRIAYRDSVSRVFYEHYDLLPRDIRNALILLHASLQDPAKGPFCINAGRIEPLPHSGYVRFVERCNDFVNMRATSMLTLRSGNQIVRRNEVVRLHARNVLRTMSSTASLFQLLNLAEEVQTRFRRRERRAWRRSAIPAIRENLLVVILAVIATSSVALFLPRVLIPKHPWLVVVARFAIILITIAVSATAIEKIRTRYPVRM